VRSNDGQQVASEVPSLMQAYPSSQQPPPQQPLIGQHPSPLSQGNVVTSHVEKGIMGVVVPWAITWRSKIDKSTIVRTRVLYMMMKTGYNYAKRDRMATWNYADHTEIII
jgi:hypothetical protein